MIKPQFCQRDSCGLDLPVCVRPQKICHVEKDGTVFYAPPSWCLLNFGSPDVDLVATAEDSVFFDKCIQVPFIIYVIQMFMNFSCGIFS